MTSVRRDEASLIKELQKIKIRKEKMRKWYNQPAKSKVVGHFVWSSLKVNN